MRRRHLPTQQWKQLIQEWQSSSLSVLQFCRNKDIPTSAFYRWKAKFKLSEGNKPKPFVQVKLSQSNHANLELVLNAGHVLRFSEATDKKALVSALEAFKEVGLC
ncbi:transposase [Neptuniibacter sp.]|uniref:IS66 family insertion sequence element accessory protein TnpA n=1 Tax=Neptuniibacter sp. TaxID=1962643 RepID=UPI0026325F48|nr:transposase [Neptuniibacter sp.]MCP4597143.1 transposase [Neptuniibacter sp.]